MEPRGHLRRPDLHLVIVGRIAPSTRHAESSHKPSFTSVVAFLPIVSPLVYVLSYAPVVRIGGRFSLVDGSEHLEHRAYKPVDWLIDNTPLKEPLFFWAGIWGVRNEFEYPIIFDMASEEATGPPAAFHAE